MMQMLDMNFTPDELREINDALSTAVQRMLDEGQTPQEIEYQALAIEWFAQRKCVEKLLPGAEPDWLIERDEQVKAAVASPKCRSEPQTDETSMH